MFADRIRPTDHGPDPDRLEDLSARSTDEARAIRANEPVAPVAPEEDDVIRIEDLTPRENVRGGRKVILGEVTTPSDDSK
jgi:hypothetical protein